ncbi:hypothetical protein BaRGS_00024845 [Batillaria attramentaria]|uniref:Uncharacterized protein n=1 Tax=Batillaria attramentaria TaxID=370345 RepID=A0ABD0KA10_9CAEN
MRQTNKQTMTPPPRTTPPVDVRNLEDILLISFCPRSCLSRTHVQLGKSATLYCYKMYKTVTADPVCPCYNRTLSVLVTTGPRLSLLQQDPVCPCYNRTPSVLVTTGPCLSLLQQDLSLSLLQQDPVCPCYNRTSVCPHISRRQYLYKRGSRAQSCQNREGGQLTTLPLISLCVAVQVTSRIIQCKN